MTIEHAKTAVPASAGPTRAGVAGHGARKHNLLGIAAVVGAGAAMISSDAFLRGAVSEIGLGAAIAGRATLACLFLTLVALSQRAIWSHPGLTSPPMRFRIAGEVGAGLLFNAALQRMPIADATAILQFIPLVTTVAAARLFAERVGWQRWLAAVAGLIGVFLILKPGTAGFTWWSLLAVGAMLCMSIRDLATSRIDSTTPTLPIGAVSAGFAALSGLVLLPLTPLTAPGPAALAMILGAATCMAAGFICLVIAMRSAEMSALAPFRYCVILWAILIGIFAWGEVPDPIAVIGILIVIAAGLVTFARERRLQRAHAAARG
jgi:drug/metabolite transporter (DMT)-like permease